MNNNLVANTNTQITTKNSDNYAEYNSPEKKEELEKVILNLVQTISKSMEHNYGLKHSSSAKNDEQPKPPTFNNR